MSQQLNFFLRTAGVNWMVNYDTKKQQPERIFAKHPRRSTRVFLQGAGPFIRKPGRTPVWAGGANPVDYRKKPKADNYPE
jgi:hypothetical protein